MFHVKHLKALRKTLKAFSLSIYFLRIGFILSSSVIFLITRQGLPTATTSSGISFVTTEPAPITE